MQARIQQWGNSVALRVPKAFVQEMRLEPGTLVEVSLQEGTLRVTPLASPLLTLDRPWTASSNR